MKKNCKICGKEFVFYPDKIHKGLYCSRECYFKSRWGKGRKITKVCKECGKQFNSYQASNQKFCSKECANRWRENKPLIKRRNRITKKCDWCGKEFSRPASNFHSIHFFCCHSCSAKWWAEYGLHREKHPRWTGKYPLISYTDGWKVARRLVLKRANNKCERCGKIPKRIEIHHKKPVRACSSIKEANNLSNLIAVCIKCHNILEKESRLKYPPKSKK